MKDRLIPDVIAPPMAQQFFTIGSGLAGGLAGFLLARKLSDSQSVNVPSLLAATFVSAAATFSSIYLIKSNRR